MSRRNGSSGESGGTNALHRSKAQPGSPPSKPKRGRGRPSKRTPETLETVIEGIRKGLYVDLACARAGIARQTLHDWRKQYPDVEKACAEAEALWAADEWDRLGSDTADPQWQRRAWRLERRMPEFFSLRQRIEHTGKDGGPLVVIERTYGESHNGNGNGNGHGDRAEILARLNAGRHDAA